MDSPQETPKGKVRFVKTSNYSSKVKRFLNRDEEEALYLMLAIDPLRGEPAVENLGVLVFGKFCGTYIWYVVTMSMDEIYLLDIGDKTLPPPTLDERNTLRELLEALKKLGVVVAVIKGIRGAKTIWDIFKDRDWGDFWG
mgnify:CR=1 FL=1